MFAADQGPTPVSQCPPKYAYDLRHDEIEGTVVVSYTITAQGDVANPVVVSSTDKAFTGATLAAIRQWKFKPAMKDGVAVNTPVRTTVNFILPYLHEKSVTAIAKTAPKPEASLASNATGQ
jgi:protein TonB